jgi:putative DNA primase/helicase
MAVKAELGEAGFDIWDEWSANSDKYRAGDAAATWKSFKTTGEVGAGTLFHYAQQYGYRCDSTYKSTAPPTGEIAERQHVAAERVAKEEAEIARERAETARKAAAISKAATEVKADHPYLDRKCVSPVATLREIDVDVAAEILGYVPKSGGEQLTGRLLVVPVKKNGVLTTLELIDGDKRKTALAGRGSKVGGYWATEPLLDAVDTLLIGEGVATALSSREASRHPAIAALSSGNLLAVAKAMRERYPAAVLVILADLVKATGAPDPHAIEAARLVGGKLAVPHFGENRDPNATDFNDMALTYGAEAVKRVIANASPPAESWEWPEPQLLTAKVEPEPYPLDALPDTIRAAVEEVVAFVKAPVPLVASAALGALSLAIQAHVDVKRAEKLDGPVGLFLLTLADSGERKSTVDRFFTASIRQHEEKQAEDSKPDVEAYEAAIDVWNAKRDGLLAAIKEATKKGQPTKELETELETLQSEKPEKPRVERLLLGDETPESLAWNLSQHWPSAGVVSSEAGVIFGAHGMGKDSVMRNLSLLNVLWDGGTHSVGRRTSESFTVRGARLTLALQVQEATLREYFARCGTLARGTGFLARFLVSCPESTQGFRPFTEPPETWPNLSKFNTRIAEILAQKTSMDENGALTPLMLTMDDDAKAAWVDFHDKIESMLVTHGELYDVRDVASKAADNVVRLAALFHVFVSKNSNISNSISAECVEDASNIISWHLNESRRLLGELAMPAELMDAARLDAWLISYCRQERTHLVPIAKLQQLGPNSLRRKSVIDTAMLELQGTNRARWIQDGKRRTIAVNPTLLAEGDES